MKKLFEILKMQLEKKRYRYFFATSLLIAILICFFAFVFPLVPAQSAESKIPDMTAAARGQKVLIFSPHPDDETIAAGGYIAQSIKNGADVEIVLVTNGNAQHNEAVRYAEFRKATAILGVPANNLVFLGLPDSKMASYSQTKLQADLKAQIDLYHPDIVIYPSPQDYNPDHAAIGRATKQVLASEPLGIIKYEYIVHFKVLYPQPYAFKFDLNLYLLPPTATLKMEKEWLKFPLSKSVETQKEDALLSYRSQLKNLKLDGLLHSFVRKDELFAIPY